VDECKLLPPGRSAAALRLGRYTPALAASTRVMPSTPFSAMHARRQGLTLVHLSAQPKPFWSHLPVFPCLTDWGEIMQPTYPTKYVYVEPKSRRV